MASAQERRRPLARPHASAGAAIVRRVGRIGLVVAFTVFTALLGVASSAGATAPASQVASVAVRTYGATLLPLTGSNLVISGSGEYVASYETSGITELHIAGNKVEARHLSSGGYDPVITSVSNDGLVAGCASCGVSGESYPFSSPFVTAPGDKAAIAPPCLFYPEPSTFANGAMEDCGVSWHGTATMGYLQYRGESAFVNGDGTVEGNSNCPPPEASGACGPPDLYSDPPEGYCSICSSQDGGLYSWNGKARSGLSPLPLSPGHAVLPAVLDAVATTGDYAGIVQCTTTFPPQATSAFPCEAGKDLESYFVGAEGGDYTIARKRFSATSDQLAVNGINSSDEIVGSLWRSGAAAPVPWEAHGADAWKQLPYPAAISVSNGRKSHTEKVTGGAALAVNDDGDVVGYVTTAGGGADQAALWTPGGQFVLLENRLNVYDREVSSLLEAVGITASGEILVYGQVRGGGSDDAILLGPVTCSHITLRAPLRYRTGETVIDYRITGVTLDCGPVDLAVDGRVAKTLPDDPSTQSGQLVVKKRICNPTVVAIQGDKTSENDEGQPADGKVLIANDVTGPEGEQLRAGDDLCAGENGAVMDYGEGASLIARSLKLRVAADGALAASTVDLPAGTVAGPGGSVQPADTMLTQDFVDDPAAGIYVSGAMLAARLDLVVGLHGEMESAALPHTEYQSPAALADYLETIHGVQPLPTCSSDGITIFGFVETSAADVSCDVLLNGAILAGTGASLDIKGGLLPGKSGTSIGSVIAGGALTIGSPTAMQPDGLSSYDGGTVSITLEEPDYSQPYMILAPLKTTTVTTAPFDYGGLVLASGGVLTLKD